MNFIKAYKYPLSITLALISIFFIFQNGTCGNGQNTVLSGTTSQTGGGTTSTTLTLTPAMASVAQNGTYQFTVSGGKAPYTFAVVSPAGAGSFSTTTAGLYTAPAYSTNVQVGVLDANSNTAYAMVTVGSLTGTPTPVPAPVKIISVTSSGAADNNWLEAKLLDGDRNTCFSSYQYNTASPATAPFITLKLANANTGITSAQGHPIDHVYLTDRLSGNDWGSGNGSKIGFPLTYTIKARKLDNSGWTTVGTFTTQPDFDGVARVTFTQVTTDQLAIVATYLTTDGRAGYYYFQLCEVGL